ncbi:MAG TPA: hypothetical protein VEA44_04065 [Caulobacter sp.]|nr:hypothetical protein [Caulobacter sp.]
MSSARPFPRRTTATRVLLAAGSVWLTASYLMGGSMLLPVLADGATVTPGALFGWLVSFPIIGALFGAPFLILAAVGWVLLHRAGRASGWLATACGAGVGAAVAVTLVAFFRAPPIPIGTALASAPLLGWLAWRIAYGGPQPQRGEWAAEAFG